MMKNMFELADREKTNIAGMLTWAFEFEGQPYFEGFRTLATQRIDKPVLNVFRMAGLMRGNRVAVESSGRVPLSDDRGRSGVRGATGRRCAGRSLRSRTFGPGLELSRRRFARPRRRVQFQIAGIPGSGESASVRHYRIDDTHSNAFTAWKKMGSPQQPTPEQYAALEAAGQLQELESPRWMR